MITRYFDLLFFNGLTWLFMHVDLEKNTINNITFIMVIMYIEYMQTEQQQVEAFVKEVKNEDGETQVRFLTMTEDPEIFRGLLSDAYVDEALIKKGMMTIEQINAKYKEETTEELMKRMEKELSS